MSKKLTKDEFIKKAIEKHGDKYDYTKVDYKDNKTKVCIICPEHEHGEFWQTPSNHTRGKGCPNCANKANGDSKRLSLTEFIKKCHKVHGDKYDYSKVEYDGAHTKVCIICPKPDHGEFWQTPSNHLQEHGCPKCSKEVNVEHCHFSKEDFIKKAHKKHPGKYDYSKVEYVNCNTKVCIKCTKHGEFWQTPSNHLQGQGCPKCKSDKTRERCTSTKEDFIKKAHKKHPGKYDYSKVEYGGYKTKVCIICHEHEHGEFWQTPHSHLKGQGCPKCANIDRWNKRGRMSTEKIVEKFVSIHGDTYDYSKVDYVNCNTKVCIKCTKHGEFWQVPTDHIKGRGCPKCGQITSNNNKRLTLTDFIKRCRKVHGGKYDYSKVRYVGMFTNVCIICPEHGEFLQSPNHHIEGCACPKCNLSHLERSVMNYLDEHGITYDYQKRFDWLGRQSLDFYLPDYNVGVECQGRQHFEAVDYFGGDKGFKHILERDKRKKALCEKQGVKLLYFGNVPNYDTFLGETVHDDVQHIIDYLKK